MNDYSQGVCEDGAVILCNGERMMIAEIISSLKVMDSRLTLARYKIEPAFAAIQEASREMYSSKVKAGCEASILLARRLLGEFIDGDTSHKSSEAKAIVDEFKHKLTRYGEAEKALAFAGAQPPDEAVGIVAERDAAMLALIHFVQRRLLS